MKLLTILAITLVLLLAIGALQHRQLQGLRAQRADLESAARTTGGSHSMPPSGSNPAGSPIKQATTGSSPSPVSQAPLSPAELLSEAERVLKSNSPTAAAISLVPTLNAADADYLIEVIEGLSTISIPRQGRDMAVSTILTRLVKLRPQAAMAQGLQHGGFNDVFKLWADADLSAATSWLAQADLPDDEQRPYRQRAQASIIATIANTDLTAALDRVAAVPDETTRRYALNGIRKTLDNGDEWLEVARFHTAGTGPERHHGELGHLRDLAFAFDSSKQQLARIESLDLPANGRHLYAQTITRTTSVKLDNALANWSIANANPDQVEPFTEVLAKRIAWQDATAARAWIDQLSDDNLRRIANQAIAPK